MSNDRRKSYALNEPRDYIAQLDGFQHIAEIEQWREPGAEEHEQPARQDAANIRDDAETRNADQRCQELWAEDELHWLERHDPKGIEFLRHLHGSDLSRK